VILINCFLGWFSLQQADQFLSSYFPEFVDKSLRLHSYWAWLEISLANDVAAARGIFENLIKSRFENLIKSCQHWLMLLHEKE
jgi:hypothetical protein